MQTKAFITEYVTWMCPGCGKLSKARYDRVREIQKVRGEHHPFICNHCTCLTALECGRRPEKQSPDLFEELAQGVQDGRKP